MDEDSLASLPLFHDDGASYVALPIGPPVPWSSTSTSSALTSGPKTRVAHIPRKSRGPDPQRRFKEGPNKTGRTGLLKCVNCRKHRVRCELQTFDLNIACKRCEEKGWRCSDEDKQFSCHREKQLVAQGLLNPPILPSLAVFKELIPGRDGVYMAILSSKKDIPQFYSLPYLPTLQLAALTPLLQSAWLIFLSRICDRSFQDLRRYKSFFIKFWQDTLNKAAVDERVVSEVLLANYIAGSSDFIYGSLYGRFLDSSPISEQLTNTLQFSRCCRALMARGIASQKMQSEAVLMWMCLASGSLLWLRASNLSPEVTLSGLDILKESLNNMSSLLLTQNSQNGEPSRTVAKDVGFAGQLQMGIHLNAGYLGVQICLDRHFYHQRCSKVSLNAFLPQSNALLGRMISLCIELEGSWGWTLDSSEADILLQISRGGFPRFIRLGRSTSRTRSLLLVILRELFAPNKSGNSKTGESELTAREAALQLYKIFFSDGHCTCSSQMFLFWVGIMLRPPVFQSQSDRIRTALHECTCNRSGGAAAGMKLNGELWEFLRGTYSCGSYGDIWRLKVNGRSFGDFYWKLGAWLWFAIPSYFPVEISLA